MVKLNVKGVALVSALLISSSSMGMQNINVAEILAKGKDFVGQVKRLGLPVSEEKIKTAANEAIDKLPGQLLGFKLSDIKAGKLSDAQIQMLISYVPETITTLNKIYNVANAFALAPAGAIYLLDSANNFVQVQEIPDKIKNISAQALSVVKANKDALQEVFREVAAYVNNVNNTLKSQIFNAIKELQEEKLSQPQFVNKLKATVSNAFEGKRFKDLQKNLIAKINPFIKERKAEIELIVKELGDVTKEQVQGALGKLKDAMSKL